MVYIRFLGGKDLRRLDVQIRSPTVVRLHLDEVNTRGFRLYLDAGGQQPLDNGEYETYTTVYRQGEGWFELSNDGSRHDPGSGDPAVKT